VTSDTSQEAHRPSNDTRNVQSGENDGPPRSEYQEPRSVSNRARGVAVGTTMVTHELLVHLS
jgi:hypothetical protein